jgi:hypothetical protein
MNITKYFWNIFKIKKPIENQWFTFGPSGDTNIYVPGNKIYVSVKSVYYPLLIISQTI